MLFNFLYLGLLSDGIQNSAPPSPSRLLKENDNQWLNSEVADFSLSSFLGHLESPVKATQSAASIAGDVSQDVGDVICPEIFFNVLVLGGRATAIATK